MEELAAAADQIKKAVAKADAADKRVTDSADQIKKAVAKADAADKRVTAAEKSVGDLKAALGDSPGPRRPASGKLPPFLTVPLRDIEFDPVCRKAIDDVRADRKADVTALAKVIVDKGMASAIGKVALTLGRSRISEVRRHILAAAFPDLLKKRLGHPIKVEVADDPPGLVQSLLIDLEAPDGPLDRFANHVVTGSEASLSLQLKPHERDALKDRVRASI